MKRKPNKHPHPYALSRYSHHFSPRRYTGPAKPIRIGEETFPTLAFYAMCLAALVAVFFDVQVWRP